MTVSIFLPIITSNVKELSAPLKKHRVFLNQKWRPQCYYRLCIIGTEKVPIKYIFSCRRCQTVLSFYLLFLSKEMWTEHLFAQKHLVNHYISPLLHPKCSSTAISEAHLWLAYSKTNLSGCCYRVLVTIVFNRNPTALLVI